MRGRFYKILIKAGPPEAQQPCRTWVLLPLLHRETQEYQEQEQSLFSWDSAMTW